VATCEPKYTALLADGIINSIPAGSIYFGGTDPGRGVPTAFCKSHVAGDPFFTVTQNALADGTYLEYLRTMYGGKIYTPTADDSQKCFQEYLEDAQKRLQEHKLRPGEDVKVVDNRVQVSGQVAVMMINGLLTKVVFDRNPDREFFVEESFPLDWMYPYLEPHGLIMKLNREPLAQMPAEALARDREYWRKVVGEMVGDWLGEETPMSEIAAFVDRVYVKKNLKGFSGDPRFVKNDEAQKLFSKLRSSIGGLYYWRLGGTAPAEYRPKAHADWQKLEKEADLAFRQAFAVCPYSPEAVFRYAQMLLQLQRFDDAVLVAESCLKVDPKNSQVRGLLENIKSYKKQSAGMEQLKEQSKAGLQELKANVRKEPANFQAALELAKAYRQMKNDAEALQTVDGVVNNPKADAGALLGAATIYAELGKVGRLEGTLEKLTKVTPESPEAWYDLAAVKAGLGKPGEALAALKQSLELSAARLKRDPKARDLAAQARKDARFKVLSERPEFKELAGEQGG
jgi:tetratricopeptide (TPR) repeat protein